MIKITVNDDNDGKKHMKSKVQNFSKTNIWKNKRNLSASCQLTILGSVKLGNVIGLARILTRTYVCYKIITENLLTTWSLR